MKKLFTFALMGAIALVAATFASCDDDDGNHTLRGEINVGDEEYGVFDMWVQHGGSHGVSGITDHYGWELQSGAFEVPHKNGQLVRFVFTMAYATVADDPNVSLPIEAVRESEDYNIFDEAQFVSFLDDDLYFLDGGTLTVSVQGDIWEVSVTGSRTVRYISSGETEPGRLEDGTPVSFHFRGKPGVISESEWL